MLNTNRNGHDRAQNNYDESVVPPEYREQSLWDALFELDNYYNSPIPIVRVENHDISTMYPEGISLDINTNTIGNFTSAPHSNPPLQTQSSELVSASVQYLAISITIIFNISTLHYTIMSHFLGSKFAEPCNLGQSLYNCGVSTY